MSNKNQTDANLESVSSFRIYIQLGIYLFGIFLLVVMQLTFNNLIGKLNATLENEKVRLQIGEIIIADIYKLEASVYKFAASEGKKRQALVLREFSERQNELDKVLSLLENGGTLKRSKILNLTEKETTGQTLVFEPQKFSSNYVLETIELRPKLLDLNNRIKQVLMLLKQREKSRLNEEQKNYMQTAIEIKQKLQLMSPLFKRMIQNANRLFYEGQKRLEALEREVASRKNEYYFIQFVLSLIVIFFIVYFAHKILRQVATVNNNLKALAQDLKFQQFALDQHAIVSGTDTDGIINYANDKFCLISGYSREELIGQNHNIVNSGLHSSETFKTMWDTISNGKVWHGEIRNQTKYGSYYWVSATIVPFLDEKRRPFKYIAIRTDITRRKVMEEKIEQSNRFLQSLTDTMGEGVYALDEKGKCIFVNPETERLTGWSKDEFLGENIHDMIHFQTVDGQHVPSHECPTYKSIKQGKTYQSDDEYFTNKNGKLFPVSIISAPLYENNSITGSVAVFQDISLRKEVEDELRRAKKIAEQASNEKSNFLANMSHEIRTPMNAIIGMCYLALQTELDGKQRNYVEKINRAAESLLRIINDILDFSKIEAGKLELENVSFDLEDVLENVSVMIGSKIEEKSIELLFDTSPQIPQQLIGDPLRLTQVLLNIANNAAKFTDSGEIILKTKVQSTKDRVYQLLFSIQDSGIGMSIEQQERLFESFSQADSSTTRKYGGTGLGLAISKNLVSLMGGEIEVESQLDVGTTFHFTANFICDCQDSNKEKPSSPVIENKSVLIVDDNQSACEILSNIASELGLKVTVAHNGNEAIQAVLSAEKKSKPYDFILMDWKMPELDGVQTLEQLSNHQTSVMPPVIMVTAYGKEEVYNNAESLDVQLSKVLIKPVTTSSLRLTLQQLNETNFKSAHELGAQPQKDQYKLDNLSGAKILLVEDNDLNIELAVDLLEGKKLNVMVAHNGREAINILKNQQFDAILMDIQMPEMDGYTATQIIRETDKSIPIIAMSANAMKHDYEKAYDVGMNDYIAKPISVRELFLTLNKWINLPVKVTNEVSQHSENKVFEGLRHIDVDSALFRIDNDEALFIKILESFVDGHANSLDDIKVSLKKGETEAAQLTAHSLKGVAGNIGADSLYNASKDLENCLRGVLTDNKNIDCESLIQKTASILNDIIADIKQFVASYQEHNGNNIPTAVFEETPLIPLLNELCDNLSNYSANSEKLIDNIIAKPMTQKTKDELIHIQKHIKTYNYEKSLEMLKQLKQAMESTQ